MGSATFHFNMPKPKIHLIETQACDYLLRESCMTSVRGTGTDLRVSCICAPDLQLSEQLAPDFVVFPIRCGIDVKFVDACFQGLEILAQCHHNGLVVLAVCVRTCQRCVSCTLDMLWQV